MTTQLSTVNIDAFRGTTFFNLIPQMWGARRQVKNLDAYAQYLQQLGKEVEAAKAAKEGRNVSIAAAAVEGATVGRIDFSKLATAPPPKRLLVSASLDALKNFMKGTKKQICGPFGVAQQSKVLKGIYVLRNEMIKPVDEQITAAQAKILESWVDDAGDIQAGYLEKFLETYEQDIENTRIAPLLQGGLGPLFDRSDYPSAEVLKDQFSLESQWLSIGVSDNVPEEIKEKAKAQFQSRMTEAAEECKDALRVSLAGFLQRLTERLTPDESGKPKVFRDSLVENVRQFCQVFDARNFLQDTELETLVGQCRTILEDKTVDAEKLRTSTDVREGVREKFAEIQGKLDAMIETKKGRRYDLADEE